MQKALSTPISNLSFQYLLPSFPSISFPLFPLSLYPGESMCHSASALPRSIYLLSIHIFILSVATHTFGEKDSNTQLHNSFYKPPLNLICRLLT